MLEVSDIEFQEAVLKRSQEIPVILEFWAPDCLPCKPMSQTLEEMATQAQNRWLLRRMDVSKNSMVPDRFRILGIPCVKAFVDGKVVRELVGVHTRADLEAWLDACLPSRVDEWVAQARVALDSESFEDARPLLDRIQKRQPGHMALPLLEAAYHLRHEELDKALALLDQQDENLLGSYFPYFSRLWFQTQTLSEDITALQKRVDARSTDHEARLQLALYWAKEENWERSLDQLIEIVRDDRRWRDGLGKKVMLRFLALIEDEELVGEWRSRLSALL